MDDPVARLSRLDSCAVSDALDKLGLSGVVTGIHRVSSDRGIAGRVLTVKLGVPDARPRATRHVSTTAIEASKPGDIIVVEQRTGVDAAAWGGILSLGAKLKGIAGVILEGPARDVDDSRHLDFPVFARSVTSHTARGRLIELATNETITVGEVPVSPGDYVIADASAVVFITQADIQSVLETAEQIAAREDAMAKALYTGKPISQVMGADYENMLNRKKS
jgi:4-hydroxy-4-methyl-2-oxoglutarate aldolase